MIEELRQGDPVILRLASGTRLTFRVREQRTTPAGALDAISQSSPGLTLVIPVEGQEWPVVLADFEAAVEPTVPAGGATLQIGQPVQVGTARVTVSQAGVATGGGSSQPGTMIFAVHFAVENTGQSPLPPGDFVMELLDGRDNRYLPSSAAMEGFLANPIEPGQTASSVARYVVPQTVAGPELTWVFSPAVGSQLVARFAIPYQTATGTPSPAPLMVEVFDAFLAEDGEILHVLADLTNAGPVALTVTEDDIGLSSSAGPGELELAAPSLPWTIDGGDTREVELMFARPEASSAVIAILGYTFEISGLQ
jgi:hypothetical protein